MIVFKSIKYKNFLSTGNAFTEIQLNRSQTTLLTAKNGGGKSTVIDAIVFALYGTPFRKINRPSLINTVNKRDLLTEIEFSISGVEYKVIRGMKPHIFEVYKNGVLINQSSDVREYQAYLETNILKMNKSSFCQVVVLGSATYVPFMMLTPQQRRAIIEDLLDIQVFSTMNSLLKQRVTANRDQTTDAKYQIDLTRERIAMQNQLIERISRDHASKVSDIQSKINKSTEALEKFGLKQVDLKKSIDALQSQLSGREDNKNHLHQLNLLREKLNDKIISVEKQINFFHDTETCSMCTQKIDHEFRGNAISERETNLQELKDSLPKLEQKYEESLARFNHFESIAEQIRQLQVELEVATVELNSEYRHSLSLEKELLKLQAGMNETVDRSKLRELLDEMRTAEEKLEGLLRHNMVLSAGSALLKDGGIKSKIIKQYIPIMNKLINKYLAQMDFFVQFELDENFNETIKSRFRDDFSYHSFSEGEKLRIDLSILFAWRSIAKMRNSASTNLLIMDEVLDGSLDASGMDEFLAIIQEMNKDSNVFVISHRGDQLFDKFHSVIKFEKQGNFSRIV